MLEHAASALFLDPGLGKTSVTLAAIKLLKKQGLVSKVLLIAPLRVAHIVWPQEIQKWSDFHGLTYTILHGPKKAERLKDDVDLYLINPEGLEWLLDAQKVKMPSGKTQVNVDLRRWKSLGFDCLVVDELSKFKHTGSVRFKAMKHVLHTFGRRWGLTGSPASNGLMDLFGQCYMIDEGRTLGRYITHYRMKYFTPSFSGFGWELRVGADKEIYERLKPMVLSMAAEDYIEMPVLVTNNVYIELPPKVRQLYDELEKQMFIDLDNGSVSAASAGVASMKCRQLTAGAIYLDDDAQALIKLPKWKREVERVHDEKLEALTDLMEELQGHPLLVAYDFGHDLVRLRERFGQNVPVIGGRQKLDVAKELEAKWNRRELPVLFAHPQAIGHGLNLQAGGNHIVWFSMTWDFELYDQFIRRLRRQGSKAKRIYVHHILAKDTVDEVMLMALKSKHRGQSELFSALKTYRSSR